jgi:hypothetical protein
MKAIKTQTSAGQALYIEISEAIDAVGAKRAGGKIAGGNKVAESFQKLNQVGDVIADVCHSLQERIQKALGSSKPSELKLAFGVKLAGEAGVPLITKGSVEGTFQVTATWDFK